MKASELRIGNYIYKNGIEEEVKYLKVEVNHIQAEGGYLDELVNNVLVNGGYEPISLTEDWFLKFGFTESSGKFYLSNDFYFSDGSLWIGNSRVHIGTDRWQYVHQLQNLYFALTGEELTVK